MKLVDRAIWLAVAVAVVAAVLPKAAPALTALAFVLTGCAIAMRAVWFWTSRW